jgi:hypothetical protein
MNLESRLLRLHAFAMMVGMLLLFCTYETRAAEPPGNSTAELAWIKGEGRGNRNRVGIYGTQGVPAALNQPGARNGAAMWKDAAGNAWLFGGQGCGASAYGNANEQPSSGELNDLWKFDATTRQWTWMKGSKIPNQPGVNGQPGVADAANTPRSRYNATTWTDGSGNLWLFGGQGFVYGMNYFSYYNDLWKYNIASGNWTWMGGTSSPNQYGYYGTIGVAGAPNHPGARYGASGWTDTSGNLWLFGGYGDSTGLPGQLNDLWKYDVSSGLWTWIKGSSTPDNAGSYGTPGVADPSNNPPSRNGAFHWSYSAGNFWLFSGENYYDHDDLWKYEPATNKWTWLRGDSSDANYGTQGVAAPGNTPGQRMNSVSWATSGTLWLFGGIQEPYGSDRNDLWKYDIASGNWTWVSGGNSTGAEGVYGSQGIPASANTPGARTLPSGWTDGAGHLWLIGGLESSWYANRNDVWEFDIASAKWTWQQGGGPNQYGLYGQKQVESLESTPGEREAAASWMDKSGNFWLFGGEGLGASQDGVLNDLWRYNPASGNWAWIGGSSAPYAPSTFGTLGVPAATNQPGSRRDAMTWTDNTGNLWLFGGNPDGTVGQTNDLWRYEPVTNTWTWMKGSGVTNQPGVYGSLNVGSADTTPGARQRGVTWTDKAGNLWLFGGLGIAAPSYGFLSDLWKYDVAANTWMWIDGSTSAEQGGSYGTRGVPAPGNHPGSRQYASSWTDKWGNFWLFGGFGYASTTYGYLNDLWKYDVRLANWTWVGGSDQVDDLGSYGTQGIAAATNSPVARYGASSWSDARGNLWLFGGYSLFGPYATVDPYGLTDPSGEHNDLWMYDVGSNLWTWVKGSSTVYPHFGVYGTRGVAAGGNIPGGRQFASAQANGNVCYLFGGSGYGLGSGSLNDLWRIHLLPYDSGTLCDLVGTGYLLSHKCKTTTKGTRCSGKLQLFIGNIGSAPAPKAAISIYSSADTVYDESDVLIGKSKSMVLPVDSTLPKTANIKLTGDQLSRFILVRIDPLNAVAESHDANNDFTIRPIAP